MSNPQMVQREAKKIQSALDEIQAMQMRIDSMLSQVKTTLILKKPLTTTEIQNIHDDLIDLNNKLLKIVPVLTGHELPKRG